MYDAPNSAVARPSRAYWAACAALLTAHALIGWFAMLIYQGWMIGMPDEQRYAPLWLGFAGLWLLFGAIIAPRWLVGQHRLLPWFFAFQACIFAAIWATEGWMLLLYWEQRVAGSPHWYYLSAALWLAMLLHLWLRARRPVGGDR